MDDRPRQSICPFCGKANNRVTCSEGLTTPDPEPGDYNICFKCGGTSVFTEGVMCRFPTRAEKEEIANDEVATASAAFIKKMRESLED